MLAGAVFAGLAATWAVGEVLDKHDEVRRDQHEVARMTNKMKTVCVGRFLIDMPEEAQVELSQARIDGFDISAFVEAEDVFHQRIAAREAELGAKPDWLGGNKNLESARNVRTESGLAGKIFMHSRTVVEGTRGNGLGVERYRDEGITVEALVHGHGISVDLAFEDRGLEWVDDLPKLVSRLVANPGNRIPAEPGFCVNRAYFRDPLAADQREQIMMVARLPSHPDIEFMLILSAGLKPEENGVLARTNAADEGLSPAQRLRISRLRASTRDIGGLVGEELAELVVEENDARVHSFWWEVNGTEDNVFIPHLVFRMTTGDGNHEPVPSSLSDRAALGLWDTVSSSIRLRPAEPLTIGQVDSPTTPIGMHASAGEHCPDSGWWRCDDGGKGIGVLGGQQQYVRKGTFMPQALLLPRRTLWEKLRGVQPSFETKSRTLWKLVDKRTGKRTPPTLPLSPASPAASTIDNIGGGGTGASPPIGKSAGCLVVSGAPCPASGWWRCEQSRALDGARWFAEGTLLPPATFAAPSGMFSRPSNKNKSIKSRSAWRLVRLANNPDQGQVGETAATLNLPIPHAQEV